MVKTIVPDAPAVPIAFSCDQLTNIAGPDALHDFEIAVLMPPLRAGHDGEALAPGRFGGGDDGANADRIDSDKILPKDAFARAQGGLYMRRTEMRRPGQDDHVHPRGDHFLISVEAGEARL